MPVSVNTNLYDMVKIRVIIIGDVNVCTIYEVSYSYQNKTKIPEKKEVPALSRTSYQLYTRYLSITFGETV